MSRLPEFCGHTDDHAEHEWTDRHERDFECPGWRNGRVLWEPAPMADSDIPAEAVEAVLEDRARRWEYDRTLDPAMARAYRQTQVPHLLADLFAALPYIRADERARVLAEVNAALRDEAQRLKSMSIMIAIDRLPKLLGAGGELSPVVRSVRVDPSPILLIPPRLPNETDDEWSRRAGESVDLLGAGGEREEGT